jgi:hypothetical protein
MANYTKRMATRSLSSSSASSLSGSGPSDASASFAKRRRPYFSASSWAIRKSSSIFFSGEVSRAVHDICSKGGRKSLKTILDAFLIGEPTEAEAEDEGEFEEEISSPPISSSEKTMGRECNSSNAVARTAFGGTAEMPKNAMDGRACDTMAYDAKAEASFIRMFPEAHRIGHGDSYGPYDRSSVNWAARARAEWRLSTPEARRQLGVGARTGKPRQKMAQDGA